MLKPTDNTGFETLELFAKARAFNEWIYASIAPWCHGNILEIGSGIGNISTFFIEKNAPITLSDTDSFYVETLKQKFPQHTVISTDLEHPSFEILYRDHISKYDTVFLLNVLEHIQHDDAAVANCFRLLKPGGNVIILTPAYPSLYSGIDKGLHHYKRYTRETLSSVIVKNGFVMQKLYFFNALGIAGWIYAKIFGLKKIPRGELSIFNRMVWFAKLLDKILLKKAGLSLIAIAQKKV